MLCGNPARGQSDERAAAEALFRAGRTALQAGDWAGACAKFRESERLERAAGTSLNLGTCEEKLGHLASAWDYYQRALQTLPSGDPRVAIARERTAALDARVAKMVLRPGPETPEHIVVTRGTVSYHWASFGVPLPVDAGEHLLVAYADGYVRRELRVTIHDGERLDVPVTLERAPEPAPAAVAGSSGAGSPGPAPAGSAPSPSSEPRSTRTLGWTIGAAGVGMIAIGAAAGLFVLHEKSVVDGECHGGKSCDSERALDAAAAGRTFGVVSTVAFAAGAIGTGIGIYFIAKDSRRATTRIGVDPAGAAYRLTVSHDF